MLPSAPVGNIIASYGPPLYTVNVVLCFPHFSKPTPTHEYKTVPEEKCLETQPSADPATSSCIPKRPPKALYPHRQRVSRSSPKLPTRSPVHQKIYTMTCLLERITIIELLGLLARTLHQEETTHHVFIVLVYHWPRRYLVDESGIFRVAGGTLILLLFGWHAYFVF